MVEMRNCVTREDDKISEIVETSSKNAVESGMRDLSDQFIHTVTDTGKIIKIYK